MNAINVLSYQATKKLKTTNDNNNVFVFYRGLKRMLYLDSIGTFFIVNKNYYYLSSL